MHALILLALASGAAASPPHPPSELIGTWRGTSVCTDRVAAPACHDEVVVYEFSAGEKPGVVRWKADKVVEGQRLPMGEMDLTYDTTEACWYTVFQGPRGRTAWCVVVEETRLTGTGRLLPGKEKIRQLDARKQ